MSDAYQVKGVTITPQGGGYYDLSHPSLPEPIRERGKDKAEARAEAIAAALSPDEGYIEPQVIPSAVVEPGDPIVTTVAVSPGELPENQVPATVPREYSSTLDDKQKETLEKMGVKTTRIILEENSDIPPTGLFIGHNGNGYMISPGEPVDVPNFLIAILNDAVMSSPVVDSKTQKVLGYRDRMKYPYRLV